MNLRPPGYGPDELTRLLYPAIDLLSNNNKVLHNMQGFLYHIFLNKVNERQAVNHTN